MDVEEHGRQRRCAKNIELAADEIPRLGTYRRCDVRKKLQDYLPPILLKTYEFPLLCETEQPEIDRLRDAADAVLDAQFLSTAGEYADCRGTRRSSAIVPHGHRHARRAPV